MLKIPSRRDIGVRVRAKVLKKLNAKKRANPEDYIHNPSEKSRYLALKYDYDMGSLNPHKLEEYERLKEIYGDKK